MMELGGTHRGGDSEHYCANCKENIRSPMVLNFKLYHYRAFPINAPPSCAVGAGAAKTGIENRQVDGVERMRKK